MVFSIVLSLQPSPALLFFKLIEVETKFPFANSISEFSRSQDPNRTSDDRRATRYLALSERHPGALRCLSPDLGAYMRRRKFLGILGGAPTAWPLAIHAQQHENPRRIGVQ